MVFRSLAAFLAGLVLLASAGRATACSLAPETQLPNNFELVQLADAIVVAKAVGGVPEREGVEGAVRFRTVKAVKGASPPEFELAGLVLGNPSASRPTGLDQANGEAYQGSCLRRTFRQGDSYVLFLGKDAGGKPVLFGIPFSRISEDYFGDGSQWMRVISDYLRIQRDNAPEDYPRALGALLTRTLDEPASPDRAERAEDIAIGIATVSRFQPTSRLLAAYDSLERGEPLADFVARAAGLEPERLKALLPRLATSPAPSIETQKAFVLVGLVNGDHAQASALFDRIAFAPGVSARTLGLAIRFFASHQQLRRAYDLIEGPAFRRLPALSFEDGVTLMGDMLRAMQGDNYEPGQERWRTDPYVAARWPEVALSLYWLQARELDNQWGSQLTPAIALLRPADYYTRPEVTLALAAGFDDDVAAWARREVADEAKRLAFERLPEQERYEQGDPMELPLTAIVVGHEEDRGAILRAAFCKGGERRRLLFEVLADWARGTDYGLIDSLAKTPGLDDDERTAVARIQARRYARGEEERRADESIYGRGSLDFEQIEKFVRGQPYDSMDPNAAPIVCRAAQAPA